MLSKQFIGKGEVKGFSFKQLFFENGVYLYEVSNEGQVWYEVFEHRINTQFGNVIYPSSKVFGVWAYSTVDYDRAIEIMRELGSRQFARNFKQK